MFTGIVEEVGTVAALARGAGPARAGRPREPRAAAPLRRRARRPPGPRPRGRRRDRGGGNPCRIDDTGADRAGGPGPRAAPDPAGLGGRGRREPHGGRARRGGLRGGGDPAHAGGGDAGGPARGAGGEHRGRRDRQVPAAIARPQGDDMTPFATVEEAIEEIRAGRILLVVDDEDRENEGDLVMAADRVTPEAVNF